MELTDRAFTVVITDDELDGKRVTDLAEQWYADELLDEFALVTPESVRSAARGPAMVTAQIIGSSDPVELMAYLGSRPRPLVRLVVLHMLTHEDSSADRLVAVCDEVANLVRRAMPVASTDQAVPRMRLLRINLLVPETDLAPQRLDILQPGWEINAIVSPEDRPDLDRVSVFVRSEANLHGHALAAAATIGGVWRGMMTAAFDRYQLDSAATGNDVIVVRCQARVIVGDERAVALAEAAVASVASVHDGAASHVKWGYITDRPSELVESTLSRILAGQDWMPSERPPQPLPAREIPLSQVIKDWLAFQATLPTAALSFFGFHAATVVERGVTRAVIGTEAGVVGRLTPVTPEAASERAAARIRDLAQELAPQRLNEDAAVWGQSTPMAWRELRDVSIGLVDGSELPGQFIRERRGNLDEVLPPSYVVPVPFDDLSVNGGADLRSLDVAGAATLAKALATRPDRSPVEESPSSVDAKQSEQTETPAARPTGESALASAQDELEAWVERRRQSLLWKLAARTAELHLAATASAELAQQEIVKNSDPPDPSGLLRAQRWLKVAWVTAFAGLALAALWVWRDSQATSFGFLPEVDSKNVTLAVLAIVVIFILGGHQYYRALKAFEWAVMRHLHALTRASDDYVASKQEEKRWAIMSGGVLDWGDILAQLLHRPWTADSTPPRVADHPYNGLPAAVAVARPAGSTTDPSPAMVAGVVEALCHRGWLKEEFDRFVGASYPNDPSIHGGAGDLPADLDLGLQPNGPRADLRGVAADERIRDEATTAVFAKTGRLVADGRVRVPELSVVRLGPYSSGDLVNDRGFLVGSNNYPTPLSSDVFSDRANVGGLTSPAQSWFTVPVGVPGPSLAQAEFERSGVGLTTRVDISKPLQPSDLLMFERSTSAPRRGPEEPSNDFN